MLRHTISVTLPWGGRAVLKRYPFPMQDIVNQGREGFKKNKRNPFPPSADRAREWERGYNQAYYECLKRLREGANVGEI